MNMVKTLFRHLGQYKRASILTPAYTALEVVMGVLIPYVTSWIIDRGIMAGSLQNVVLYGGLMLLMAALSLFFGIQAGRYSAIASSGFAYNLRAAMYRNIQSFSFSNIDKFSTASLITRMTTDLSSIQNAYQMLLRVSVRAPFTLIFSIFMCLFINLRMSIIFLVALLILGVLLYFIIGSAVKLFTQVFKKYDGLNASVQENVSAIREVKAFVREDYENEKFTNAATELYNLSVKTESIMALNSPVMMLVVYGCIISLSWFGAQFIVAGNLTTGQLTSLFAYVMSILMSLMMLSVIFVMVTMSAAAGRRVAEVIEEEADIVNPIQAIQKVEDGSIDFEHVSFSYEQGSGEYAIRDIDLHIRSGETIGIIGGTGCGKTTMVNLISRLYEATLGTVKVGGIDVRNYDLDALRNKVSMVLQKNVLFSGTVLDNLRWGNPDATLDECQEACRLACADEFIQQMPDKYDTWIDQNGTNVSGGQRQRLCIARALLKKPKVIILDDSTSACDTATDARIRKAFAAAIPGTTKLIIAQRIQSVQEADRIVVMNAGIITGIGTHQEMLDTNEIYQEIYHTQMQGGGDFDERRDV